MISIIIVHYQVKKDLFECIQSIIKSNPKKAYEIIIVDNDIKKTIRAELNKKFPKVIYIPNENKGFGQGNNVGSKKAKGDYLYFLNPDTKVFDKGIDILANFLEKHNEVAIAAPILVDSKNKIYQQGAQELTPISAIFSFSIINKIFPKNPIAKKYWMINEWNRDTVKEVASVPGTAFMIRSDIFRKIKGFDENFFMYFEEHDLCRRVSALGSKIMMIPNAKVFHALGQSSKQVSSINAIFQKSRFYYFKKHFGLHAAFFTEIVMRTSKYSVLLISILLIGLFLLLYRLQELMLFIGDQGWFYLSARDIILTGQIPLVGITSSHPWLHQGALWTYMLAFALGLTHFNPVSGAYLSVIFGLLSTMLIYRAGSEMFSSRVGIIAALLYATSPLAIFSARTPYHTAPITFFTLLYILFLFRWLEGRKKYFPLIIFTLAILYNLEIATFLLSVVLILVLVFLFFKNKTFLKESFYPRLIIFSIISFIIPMLPMLIYDISHGFPQTFKFLAWNIYKIATIFGMSPLKETSDTTDLKSVFLFLGESYRKLIYLPSNLVAFTVAVFSFGFFYKTFFRTIISQKSKVGIFILGLITIISVAGIIASKTVSDAYFPILYSPIILITALFFDKLIVLRPRLKTLIVLIILTIAAMNVYAVIKNNFLITKERGLAVRMTGAKQIVTESNGRMYNLVGKGEGSQFESFTMNYEYLAWWLGNGPSHKPENLKFVISEDPSRLIIKKLDKHD
jgi:GT2 family glycosyltransferase